ncbi:response regulator receiver protein [Stanieria cyanosphaera PCC 7437]|uniref:Response regulator receiver protein n=1 Tax=Stanieria cyanosphaera (strain ATCC 29371 / PCC 7437) TaxID=111780 RepID=K9XWS5_STAC7|nr:response regulator [Stanieria cyanosphaera]AFZ37050.1 response regulator receiver protein [Stanieria cyanosphaera PCC 7437]
MQGDLQDISFSSLIKFLELNQQTGTLFVETRTSPFPINQTATSSYSYLPSKSYFSSCPSQLQTWLIFFKDGKIFYAANSQENALLQLKDYLHFNLSEKILNYLDAISDLSGDYLEYRYLFYLLQKKIISPLKAQKILKNILRESLFQILKLSQGKFFFQSSQIHLNNYFEFNPEVLMNEVLKELQYWYKLTPYIHSETQYFSNCHQEQLKKKLAAKTYQTVSNWIQHKTSLLQASRQLNCSVVALAKTVYPYLTKSWIKLLAEDSQDYLKKSINNNQQTSHIIYIDNDVTNGKNVEYILKQRNYKLTVVQDSIEALSLILKTQPDAILCNVDLPQITGYELCSMLQNSQISRQIPIILVAECEDCLDLEKAKLVCTGDYLIKPFINDELLILLEKHIKGTKEKQLHLIS